MSKRQFRLTIDTGNDLFMPEPHAEIARILRECADRIEGIGAALHWFSNLKDANGDVVGVFAEKQIDAFRDRG